MEIAIINMFPVLYLVCLRANIFLLGIFLVRTKLKGERMACNIGQDAYLVLYNKRVIALILRNIVPRSISYYTRKLVQYDILLRARRNFFPVFSYGFFLKKYSDSQCC
jgi:hypothetical protein